MLGPKGIPRRVFGKKGIASHRLPHQDLRRRTADGPASAAPPQNANSARTTVILATVALALTDMGRNGRTGRTSHNGSDETISVIPTRATSPVPVLEHASAGRASPLARLFLGPSSTATPLKHLLECANRSHPPAIPSVGKRKHEERVAVTRAQLRRQPIEGT